MGSSTIERESRVYENLSQPSVLIYRPCDQYMLYGITVRFQTLSRSEGQVAHALLTRPPLSHIIRHSEKI
jgi:hypothetical protein